MPRMAPRIEIGIPLSTFFVEHSKLLGTYKIGVVARAAAIYRVDTINLYLDDQKLWRESRKVKKLFTYLLVAPYLRKKVFPKNDADLKYAGALPPLNLYTHGVQGNIRQALVVSKSKIGINIDAGLGKPLLLKRTNIDMEELKPIHIGNKTIIHVLISKKQNRIIAEPPPMLPYTGYTVEYHNSLGTLVKRKKPTCLIIGTSKYGTPITRIDELIASEIMNSNCLLILFGAPRKGLKEISKEQNLSLNDIAEYVIQTIEEQGLVTIRTEEAVLSTLSILKYLLGKHSIK